MVKSNTKDGAAAGSREGGHAGRGMKRPVRSRPSRYSDTTPEAKARRKLKYSKSGREELMRLNGGFRSGRYGTRPPSGFPVHGHGGSSSGGGGDGGVSSSGGGGGGGGVSSSGGGRGGRGGVSARVPVKSERQEVLDAAKQLWEQLRLASSRGGSRRDAAAVAKERATASALVTKLLGMLSGRLQEFSLRHDGSRIIQWLLKRGTKAQRGAVAAELLSPPSAAALSVAAGRLAMAAGRGGGGGGGGTGGSFAALPFVHTLLNDRYGTHLVVQLLRYGDTSARRTVGEAVRGHVSPRLRNPYAASAIDFGFQVVWPASLKRGLVLELLFAKQLRLLDAATKAAAAAAAAAAAKRAAGAAAVSADEDLAAAEAAARENKKGPKKGRKQPTGTAAEDSTAAASRSVEAFDSFSDALALVDPVFQSAVVTSAAETLTSMAEKPEMLKRALVHAAIAEWFDVAMPVPEYAATIKDLATTLSPHLAELAFTRPGATAAVHIVRLLDARGRKRVVRAIKPHISDLAGDECGHMVLLAVYAAIDDTKLVTKAVTTVLLTPLPGGDAPPLSRAKAAAAAATEAADRDMDIGDDDEGDGAMDTSSADAEGDIAGDDKDPDDGNSDDDGGGGFGNGPRAAREQEALLALIRSRFPRLVLLHILFPADTRYFHPSVYGPVWADTPAHFGILSRKDPAVRRREVLAPFLAPLSAVMQRYAGVLLADSGSAPIVLGAATLDATRSVTLDAVGAALAAPDPANDGTCGEGAADGLAAFLASRSARRSLRALLMLAGPSGVNAVVTAMGEGGAARVADAARPLDPPVEGGTAFVEAVLERGRGGGDAVLAVARAVVGLKKQLNGGGGDDGEARAALLATAKSMVRAHKAV